jgi:hypothetical protein
LGDEGLAAGDLAAEGLAAEDLAAGGLAAADFAARLFVGATLAARKLVLRAAGVDARFVFAGLPALVAIESADHASVRTMAYRGAYAPVERRR